MKEPPKWKTNKCDWEPVDPSSRMPFIVPNTVSPTRHQQEKVKKLPNISISSMSARYTFFDELSKKAEQAPGPASYRTSNAVAKTFKSHDMAFEPKTRELRVSSSLSCNEYIEKEALDKAYLKVLPSVSKYSFSRLERFEEPKQQSTCSSSETLSWLHRSTSVGAHMNLTERFVPEKAELPRLSKGKRWYDF